MQSKAFDRLLLFTLFFMAYWFFGNLYEEIVLVPNHLTNPFDVLTAYHSYFVLSSPTIYFVPLTQISVIVLFVLYFKCESGEQKQLLKKASLLALGALIVTAVIVTQINLKLFSPDFAQYRDTLLNLSTMWLIFNVIRMILVGSSLYFILRAYTLRQTLKLR